MTETAEERLERAKNLLARMQTIHDQRTLYQAVLLLLDSYVRTETWAKENMEKQDAESSGR